MISDESLQRLKNASHAIKVGLRNSHLVDRTKIFLLSFSFFNFLFLICLLLPPVQWSRYLLALIATQFSPPWLFNFIVNHHRWLPGIRYRHYLPLTIWQMITGRECCMDVDQTDFLLVHDKWLWFWTISIMILLNVRFNSLYRVEFDEMQAAYNHFSLHYQEAIKQIDLNEIIDQTPQKLLLFAHAARQTSNWNADVQRLVTKKLVTSLDVNALTQQLIHRSLSHHG